MLRPLEIYETNEFTKFVDLNPKQIKKVNNVTEIFVLRHHLTVYDQNLTQLAWIEIMVAISSI